MLRNLAIERPDQVWCADITYVPMPRGHAYLCAVMDWHSRKVLGWAVSNTMGVDLCLAALKMVASLEALNEGREKPLKVGIGLNTGPCCVGNMGAARRLSYSLIGDTVNLASRIEGLTKTYGNGPIGTSEVCLRSFAKKIRALIPQARQPFAPAPGWSRT